MLLQKFLNFSLLFNIGHFDVISTVIDDAPRVTRK